MFKSVIAGFIIRRLGDIVFWIGNAAAFLVPLWMSLSPTTQDTLLAVVTRRMNWQDVSIGVVFATAVGAFNFYKSWRATVKDQVVSNGQRHELPTAITPEKPVKTRTTALDSIVGWFKK